MASTDTQKPTDTSPAVENPTKTVDIPVPAAAAAAKPDLPVDPPSDTPTATTPSSVVDSAENGSKPDTQDPKTAAADDSAAPATAVEKKMRRAERFGISVQLTEEEKRNSRAERYRLYLSFLILVNLGLGFFLVFLNTDWKRNIIWSLMAAYLKGFT